MSVRQRRKLVSHFVTKTKTKSGYNENRRLIWLQTLQKFSIINHKNVINDNGSCGISSKIAGQVRLDVDRAFSFNSGVPSEIEDKQDILFRVIMEVLTRNPTFKYYQGFHEICSLFVILFEDEVECGEAVNKFSNNFISGFLNNESFDKILKKYTQEALKLSSSYTLAHGRIRSATTEEQEQFSNLILKVCEIVEPHGLIASWFLTWFVHEFPNFGDSFEVFDFLLTQISDPKSTIYLASSLIILNKKILCDWTEDPFDLIMFLRNLPKITHSHEAIECAKLIHRAHVSKYQSNPFVLRFWTMFLTLQFIYYILSITILPDLKSI